jgi:hypothetical protein
MAQPLAEGELLYVTDDQKLYVGGKTPQGVPILGGVLITGFTAEEAIDAAGNALAAGIHSGITFTYGLTQDLANRIDATIDLSTYSGTITGDIVGSVFSDGSTMLVDGTNGQIMLDGTVKGNIVPNANEVYDLGSASNRFRDLYLSGSSIRLGNAVITSTGSAVNLPEGSTVNGLPLNANLLTEISANVIADDSTTIVNTTTKTVNAAGGLFGTLLGDVKGSIFADDSTLLVDAIDNKVYATGGFETGVLTILDNNLSMDPASILPVSINNTNQQILQAIGLNTSGTLGSTPSVSFYSSRGTIDSPTSSQAGDYVMVLNLGGYNNGNFQATTSIISTYDPSANMSDPEPASNVAIVTNNNNGGSNIASLDYRGVFNSPIFRATGYATGSLPTAGLADEGFIVFDSDSKQFKGWNGTAWVVLG